MGISAVVITFNEEANIERCLRGLRFADEIVVLDSVSTDRTVELARQFTDRVSTREFVGFSDQKSAAMQLASHEWVLSVDADEVVTEELAEEIVAAVENGSCDAYRMPRSTFFLGRRMRHCGWYPDYQLRLARKSKAHYPARLVHERIEVSGTCGTLRSPLVHYSYGTMDDYVRKMVLYSRAAARQKFAEGRRFRLADLVCNPGSTFLRMYVLKQGFRDGLHGLVLSALTACSSALRYAALWEMGLGEGRSKEPIDVD